MQIYVTKIGRVKYKLYSELLGSTYSNPKGFMAIKIAIKTEWSLGRDEFYLILDYIFRGMYIDRRFLDIGTLG